MKLLRMWKDAREDFEEVEAIVGANGLGLIGKIAVGSHKIPKSGGGSDDGEEFYYIFFHSLPAANGHADEETNGSPQRFRFADLSHGTRRIIRMVVSMIFDRGSVMLIEHPEDGIHRRLTASVFGTLKSYTDPSQIIVASHSPIVFDMLDPEEIRVVSQTDGKTAVRALTPEEADRRGVTSRSAGR